MIRNIQEKGDEICACSGISGAKKRDPDRNLVPL